MFEKLFCHVWVEVLVCCYDPWINSPPLPISLKQEDRQLLHRYYLLFVSLDKKARL